MACNTTAIDTQNALNTSSSSLDTCQLVEVDFWDHENWLVRSLGGQGKDTQLDFQTVLHQDINCNNNELQVMRRCIEQRIEELKQVPQKIIDTRTFTRPKKRVSRPALETMLEVPIMENRQLLSSPWFAKNNLLSLRDNIDDVTISFSSDADITNKTLCKSVSPSINSSPHISGVQTKFEVPAMENRQLFSSPWFTKKNLQSLGDNIEDVSITFTSLTSEPDILNQTFCKNDSPSINSSFRHISGIKGDEKKNNSGFHFTTENLLFNTTLNNKCSAGQTNHKPKEQGNINATDLPTQDTGFPYATMCIDRDTANNSEIMNSTFSVVDGTVTRSISRHSGRTASCESGLDEDQLSSASDSSYSSASKPMNVGDVQIIAHIQEESLKQANSTPVRGYVNDPFSNSGDELPSPIVPGNCPDTNHGYQSDHSDHSSGDSRAKSSRSSVRSSCSSSPYGSTNLLSNMNDNVTYQHPVALQSRVSTSVPSAQHHAIQRPTVPVLRQPENVRPRPSSSLRPPSIRPPRINTIPPQGRPSSGIPRPPSRLPSRLPAPKIRSSNAGQPPSKTNKMPGYY
ncbi:uncharacterized protein LOC124621968 isoform X1 [Schistocerca americana]|nr:uncharacterized protein LOC124621968 isoform X1 [Schistocerca americana]